MTRIADELAALIRFRAFDVTSHLARSAEVKAFPLADRLFLSEQRGDVRREFARRASKRSVL